MKSEKIKKIKSNDAFGQALWDYYYNNNRDDSHVIERDDGLLDTPQSHGMQLYFSEYKDWMKVEKEGIKFAKGKVLDIGCGAGRHSLYLQNKGYFVKGIDSSPLAIKISKLRGLKSVRVLSFNNIGNLFPWKYDTVLMLGNNFGLFGSFDRAKKLLKILYSLTNHNGLIIATTLDPYNTKSKEHLDYHKLNRARGRMGGQAKIRIRYKKIIGDWYDYLFVSKDELKKILVGTGWKIKRLIDERNSPVYGMILVKDNT